MELYNDVIIQELSECMQTKPCDGLKVRVLESAAGDAAHYSPKQKMGFRTLLIAAAIALFLLTTGFVYGGELIQTIKQLTIKEFWIPGNIRITQLERWEPLQETMEDESQIAGLFKIRDVNHCIPHYGYYAGEAVFSSVDELAQAAAFEVKAPKYIPSNAEFSQAIGLRFSKDEQIHADEQIFVVDISYKVHKWFGEGSLFLTLFCAKAPPDTTIWTGYATDQPIEQVMIGEFGAAAIFNDDEKYIKLLWKNADVQYELSSGTYDLETLIAIAESID